MISINVLEMIAYFVYSLSMITLGVCVNRKLYGNVKNEEHLEKGKIIQRIMKTHSMVQCFAWPCLITFAFLLKLNKHLNLEMVDSSCLGYIIIIQRFFNNLNGFYGGFNSLIMAISRYVCIIYQDAVERYGVRKLRKVLIGSSIGVPVFLAITTEALTPVEDVWGSLFMPNYTNPYDLSKTNYTALYDDMVFKMPHSPLYQITNMYLPSEVQAGLKLFWKVSLVLIHLNILEGIMYLHVYIYYYR